MCSLVVESVLCSADVTSLRSWAILEREGVIAIVYLLISLCFLHLVMFLLTVYDYLVQK